jgi:TPR repeat protein
MTKIILTMALLTTMNVIANPFKMMDQKPQQTTVQVSQKFVYVQRAAKQGNARAQFDLGIMYAKGEGVAKSERAAFNWIHKAARNGHVEAKFYMGLSFAQGIGVRQQPELARYWFKLAAKAGHAQAVAHLASIERSMQTPYSETDRVALNK